MRWWQQSLVGRTSRQALGHQTFTIPRTTRPHDHARNLLLTSRSSIISGAALLLTPRDTTRHVTWSVDGPGTGLVRRDRVVGRRCPTASSHRPTQQLVPGPARPTHKSGTFAPSLDICPPAYLTLTLNPNHPTITLTLTRGEDVRGEGKCPVTPRHLPWTDRTLVGLPHAVSFFYRHSILTHVVTALHFANFFQPFRVYNNCRRQHPPLSRENGK